MGETKPQCNHEWVWVEKYSDLVIPEIDHKTPPDYVDVHFYRCRKCGEVKAVAD